MRADGRVLHHARLAPKRVEAIFETVQIAAVAQDFADCFSAAVCCAAAVYFDQSLSGRGDGDSSARAGAAVFRVGSSGGRGERAGWARALSRADLEPGD